MKLEFLVRDKDMVKMLMLNEVEYFYNSHLFDLLKKEALMDGDNKTSNMFYKYVSNVKDIVNGSIVEKIDGSLCEIYLGLNDNSQRHGFKIEPFELSLGEKRNVILKYVYKKSNKKLLTDGVNNIVVMDTHYDGENYISEEVVRLNKELSSFYYFERGMFDKVDFDYIDSKFLKIRKIAMFNYSDLMDLLEEERLERRLTADKEILRKVMKR
ncbi:MAG TPA: hypothetical protein DD613_03140 [Firmicutes bacterium]|nr:hypothetical protein [Bacillota bacterium]